MFQPAAVPPQAGQYAPPPPPGAYPGEAPAPGAMAPPAKLLRGFLVAFQTNPSGDFWPLFTGRVTIGRANAAEPAEVALSDATISSRHAALTIDASTIVVEDTSSTNGTYVNEEHIGPNGRRELRDGDRVRFGGYTTVVKILGRLG
jgi:pSer/pThr/pTyr-binding forkhead associated (FHA) protein